MWQLTVWLVFSDPSLPADRLPEVYATLAECLDTSAVWHKRVEAWRARSSPHLLDSSLSECRQINTLASEADLLNNNAPAEHRP